MANYSYRNPYASSNAWADPLARAGDTMSQIAMAMVAKQKSPEEKALMNAHEQYYRAGADKQVEEANKLRRLGNLASNFDMLPPDSQRALIAGAAIGDHNVENVGKYMLSDQTYRAGEGVLSGGSAQTLNALMAARGGKLYDFNQTNTGNQQTGISTPNELGIAKALAERAQAGAYGAQAKNSLASAALHNAQVGQYAPVEMDVNGQKMRVPLNLAVPAQSKVEVAGMKADGKPPIRVNEKDIGVIQTALRNLTAKTPLNEDDYAMLEGIASELYQQSRNPLMAAQEAVKRYSINKGQESAGGIRGMFGGTKDVYSLSPVAAAVSNPAVQSPQSDVLRQAQEAIAKGANPVAVKARLKQMGYNMP